VRHLAGELGPIEIGEFRLVAELNRRIGAVESRGERIRGAADPVAAEISELGTLVKQLAETVAAHESEIYRKLAVDQNAPVVPAADAPAAPAAEPETPADTPAVVTSGVARSFVGLTRDGIRACKAMSSEGIKVNVTLCFSPAQALLAAKAGATYISPFVGRLDDIATNGMELIHDIVEIYANYDFTTEILVASCRHPIHVVEAAKMGADIATCPPAVIDQMFNHPLTTIGLEKFLKDWEKVQAVKA